VIQDRKGQLAKVKERRAKNLKKNILSVKVISVHAAAFYRQF